MKKTIMAVAMMLSAAAATSPAEELELFNARKISLDDWTWSNASIGLQDGKLAVAEINKSGDYGNTFVENYLPYHPSGVIVMDVAQVVSGDYTLQVLSFAGKSHIATSDPIKSSRKSGRQEVRMADLKVPPECDALLLKVWVGGGEGARVLLENLTYTLVVDDADVVRDETFTDLNEWEAADLNIEPGTDGARLTLAEGKGYGSILYRPLLERHDGGRLFVRAPFVSGGTITLQVVAFGENGYLDSVDAIPAFTGGWRGIPLDRIQWPEGATHFRVKLWLGGAPETIAEVDRIMVLKN